MASEPDNIDAASSVDDSLEEFDPHALDRQADVATESLDGQDVVAPAKAISPAQVYFAGLDDSLDDGASGQDMATMSLAPGHVVAAPLADQGLADGLEHPTPLEFARDPDDPIADGVPTVAHAAGKSGPLALTDGTDLDALSREASRSAAGAIRLEQGGSAMVSPEEAMWHNELARYRFVINVVLAIVGLGLAALPFLSGSPTVKTVLFISMGVLAVICWWQRQRLNSPERMTRNGVIVTWLTAAVTTCIAVTYFGLFSQSNVMLAMELLLIGLTGHRLLIGLFFAITVLFVALMGTLICTDTIADPGLIHASYLDGLNQVLALVLTESVMIAALLLGLSTRREIVATFDKLQQAGRLLARQQAMVREVRQDLKRAANVGGRGPLTGQILGSFRLGVLIGRGGMGEVYQAAHTSTHELAAVKVLQASAMAEEGAMRRFAREVAVARSLAMPNIVRVLEVGGEDNLPYLAMEYLRGHDLARYLRKRGQLPLDKVVKLVREVGAGIHAAGQAGVVHRDIKPHNLFLAEEGAPGARDRHRVWKILDFGVATAQSHTGTLTRGRVIGTPAYMAPEQARGMPVTHAADLYALASIVYRSLTGHPPFSGDDLPSLLYRVVHEMPPRPSRLADIPEAFDAVLAVGMAKAPEDRFASAEALGDAVSEAAHGRVSAAILARAEALGRTQPWR